MSLAVDVFWLQLAYHPAQLGQQLRGDLVFGRSYGRHTTGYGSRSFQPGQHGGGTTRRHLLGDGERRQTHTMSGAGHLQVQAAEPSLMLHQLSHPGPRLSLSGFPVATGVGQLGS